MIGTNWIMKKPKSESFVPAVFDRIDESMGYSQFRTAYGRSIVLNKTNRERARDMLPELAGDEERYDSLLYSRSYDDSDMPMDLADGGVVMPQSSFMWPYNLPSLNEPLWLIPRHEQLNHQMSELDTSNSYFAEFAPPLESTARSTHQSADLPPFNLQSPILAQEITLPIYNSQPSDTQLPRKTARIRAKKTAKEPMERPKAVESDVVSMFECQVEQQYTMPKKDSDQLTVEQRHQLVEWNVRFMKERFPEMSDLHSLLAIANDIAPLLNIRFGNVSSYVSGYDNSLRRVVHVTSKTGWSRTQLALTMDGVHKMVTSSRTKQAGAVCLLLEQHFSNLLASLQPNEGIDDQ